MTDPKEALTHDMKRRSVLKAAAWTAPVVAAATVVPLAAATTTPPPPAGGNTSTPNFGAKRGVQINLVDESFVPTAFPAGASIELTVTGSGSISGLTVSGGTFSGGTPDPLTAGTYTITPTAGGTYINIIATTITGSTSYQSVISGPTFETVTTGTATLAQ
ncbi:MAG: hypothetical protein LKI24_12040 [Acidipropionibacterium sp.]|jgi:hypothetical protein|nr:hypothetical protein [Acidipropionibacterium sp.]